MDMKEMYQKIYRLKRITQHANGRHEIDLSEFYEGTFSNIDEEFAQTVRVGDAVIAAIDSFHMRNWRDSSAKDARRILENMFGGVTRERGFSRNLSDREAMLTLRRYGFVIRNGKWHDAQFERLINGYENALNRKLTASEIWGEY